MNKIILVIALITAVAFGVWYFAGQSEAPAVNEVKEVEKVVNIENIITFTNSGFSPSPLTVKVGDTVKFVNNSDKAFWPASAMHPTHKTYPGSDIEKCDTDERGSIFDACEGIAPGRSWEFTFTEVGEWGYHDHLNAKFFGKVIVE